MRRGEETQRGEHVMMERETGVLLPEAKAYQGPLGTEMSEAGSSAETLEGA